MRVDPPPRQHLPPVRPRTSALTSTAARLRSGVRSGSAPAAPRPLPRPPLTPPRQGRAPWMRLPAALAVSGLYEARGGCSRSLGGLVAPSASPQHYAAAASLPRWPPVRPAHYQSCPPTRTAARRGHREAPPAARGRQSCWRLRASAPLRSPRALPPPAAAARGHHAALCLTLAGARAGRNGVLIVLHPPAGTDPGRGDAKPRPPIPAPWLLRAGAGYPPGPWPGGSLRRAKRGEGCFLKELAPAPPPPRRSGGGRGGNLQAAYANISTQMRTLSTERVGYP